MHIRNFLPLLLGLFVSPLWSQQIPINGVADNTHSIYAFTNCHLVISSELEVENGTLLIQDGLILSSGLGITIPENAIVYNLQGKYIYPSFIELRSDYGLPPVAKRKPTPRPEFVSPNNGTTHWNDAIHPQLSAFEQFQPDSKKAAELYSLGFGVVLSYPFNGIMRGGAVLVSLGDNAKGEDIIDKKAAACYSFGKGNSSQSYPSSLMGSIALFRQTMYDAQWYESTKQPASNESLRAITANKNLPQIFDARNYQSVLRVSKIGREFNIPFIAVAGGDEYKRINEIKGAMTPLIVPLDFPKAIDVSDPLDAEYVTLEDLKHWEMAPTNPAIISQNGIPFALTASANQKEFWSNLRKSIQFGLDPHQALKALTYTPAKFLNKETILGTLESGKMANFFISDNDVFVKRGKIFEHWIQGRRNVISDAFAIDPIGVYNMNVDGKMFELSIKPTPKGYVVYSSLGATKEGPQKGSIAIENNLINLVFTSGTNDIPGPIRFIGKSNFQGKILDGKAQDSLGVWVNWSAIKQQEKVASLDPKELQVSPVSSKVSYPNMAFGDTALPQTNNYFIANVTIWSCDSVGNFKGSVVIENGKIKALGKNITNLEEYKVIDGANLHLTPGIIDEHSHIAVKNGVNEGGQNNSAEVRIGDVLHPEDINIYRQLAGGVTTAQLLHGSANPIGGQAQIIKLRWGAGPEELKFVSPSKSIKFALGENVTQANSDRRNSIRFPQTRMGVEQVYFDAFNRAKAYEKEWSSFSGATKKERKSGVLAPRRDLELDALVEILRNERNITCHSYIQSEITMLMNVADSMGFRINTFTHILEGYKVADKMKAHGANASTFSDWWAYKFEVNDAIPYNAAILNKMGVLTAINSDDAEMGSRLNQEAAKTVKYGGVSEIEAMKMITINPAQMLKIDHLTGSISMGKDADLVLWSDHPLSIYAHPKMVWIDGKIYFSEERNEVLLEENKKEKLRLINAMIKAKDTGQETENINPKEERQYHCDSYEDEMEY